MDGRPAKRARVSVAGESDGESKSKHDPKVNAMDAKDDDDDEEDEVEEFVPQEPHKASDLYLDTINRLALDFDFEKLCSVCLSDIHVYGCLVCGKYFQGRGKSSYAYAHSVHEDHHVFINLETTKVYVLPDGYEVSDPSLEDIAFVLNPSFTRRTIRNISEDGLMQSTDLASVSYIPGYIGLNNIKHNDHLNVIIHTLTHVPPLRDFLLLSQYTAASKEPELLKRFATLTKKIWNNRLFKAQVSPHEFLQEVNRASKGRYRLENRGDPAEFMGWLLNRLHMDMGGTKKPNSSVIYACFQGALRLESQKVLVKADREDDQRPSKPTFDIARDVNTTHSPFLFLALDLPPPPLFQDVVEKNIIPQVTLASVLAKYDGITTNEALGQIKRLKCTKLPPYLILHYKRFTKNNFVEEKNPTIVNFPLKGVDFRDYIDVPANVTKTPPPVYDLLVNVTHESTAGTARDKENTVWKVHLRAGSGENERWFQVQDLIVETVQKEMIFLGEVVIQVWERRDMRREVTKMAVDS